MNAMNKKYKFDQHLENNKKKKIAIINNVNNSTENEKSCLIF